MVRMRSPWLLAGILSVAVFLATSVNPSEAHPRRPSLARLQAELGLSDDQVRAIHQLHVGQWEARHQLRKALREARTSLRELILTGGDEAAIQAKTAEVQQLLAQALQMRVTTMRGISQILTPEQREKFQRLRSTWH